MTDRLAVERLSIRFGGLVAVRDLSLRVAPARYAASSGPMAGQDHRDQRDHRCRPGCRSDVRLDGELVSGLPAHAISRRGIGRTFQHVEPFGETVGAR